MCGDGNFHPSLTATVYIVSIPRIQPSFSQEGYALIVKHAREAGMSAAAYVRDAASRSAGWDEAMSQLRDRVAAIFKRQSDVEEREAARDQRIADLEERQTALEREIKALKRKGLGDGEDSGRDSR